MKVIVQAEEKNPRTTSVAMSFEDIGSEAWIAIEINGNRYEIDYRDFMKVARALSELD
jgi:hypothetical protein